MPIVGADKVMNSSASIKCKIYVSDEGYGPLVRQSAIIEAFRQRTNVRFEVQTHDRAARIGNLLDDVEVCEVFNNIRWAKKSDGSPDILRIREFFKDYEQRADRFIVEDCTRTKADFLISDFVYEAFRVGHEKGIKSFGLAHFTWDWFFSKIFPSPVCSRVLDRMYADAMLAEVLYFPPFTPSEILCHYASKAKIVPLIVRSLREMPEIEANSRFKVLIMDSGSSVLSGSIEQAACSFADLPDFQFYISSKFNVRGANITPLDPSEIFSDYMPHMNLVICRAGFNTISECLAYRTPFLLIGEAVNPEMSENVIMMKRAQLGSMVSLEAFTDHLTDFLPRFVEHEYSQILHHMGEHEFHHNGAEVVADDILNRLERL